MHGRDGHRPFFPLCQDDACLDPFPSATPIRTTGAHVLPPLPPTPHPPGRRLVLCSARSMGSDVWIRWHVSSLPVSLPFVRSSSSVDGPLLRIRTVEPPGPRGGPGPLHQSEDVPGGTRTSFSFPPGPGAPLSPWVDRLRPAATGWKGGHWDGGCSSVPPRA